MNKRDTDALIRILGTHGTAATVQALAAAARWHQRVSANLKQPLEADEWDRAVVNLEAYSANLGKWVTDQASAIKAFAQPNHPAVAVASREYGTDEIEVDAEAMISESEDGCWVSAWVWVASNEYEPEAQECEGCDTNMADPPSKLCPGCQAYRDHQS